MLRIHKLTPGAGGNGAKYYTDLASKDITAYYAGSGEAPGVWLGNGLDDLMATMNRAGKGGTPNATMDASGAKLFEYLNSKQAAIDLFPPQRRPSKDTDGEWVSGYDFTFSAPKGLSMLATMTDRDDLRRAIYEAHTQAVKNAMAAIESDICYGREGKAGKNLVKGGGMIAAAFRHRTARPAQEGDIPDPHLHTHVVVANMVRHPDGTYGALDGRAFTEYGNLMALAAGALYRSELARALDEAGVFVEWRSVGQNGAMDVVGIPDELIKAFSSRQAVIERELEKAGMGGTKANLIARQKTQKAKDKEVASASDAGLSTLLRTKLESIVLPNGKTARVDTLHRILHGRPIKHDKTDLQLVAQSLIAPPGEILKSGKDIPNNHLTQTHATFTYWELVAALARETHGRTSYEEIRNTVQSLLQTQGVIELENEVRGDDTPSLLPWHRRYTTPEILNLEQGVVAMTRVTTQANRAKIAKEQIDTTGLSKEQVAMCEQICTSGNGIDIVVGAAGTGKTYALQRCYNAWSDKKVPVIGCAKSARAAGELEAGSGITSITTDKLLSEIRETPKHDYLPKGCVVVLDEAGMAETRQLAELSRYVNEAKGKLVLIGDDKQLGAVAAGGLFGHLAETTDHVELHENVRNREQAALLANLRIGRNVSEIVTSWKENEVLHITNDRLDAITKMVNAWEQDRADGKDSQMLAVRKADVAALNLVARAKRIERGEIDKGKQVGENYFSVGDRIMTTRNDKRYTVKNSDRGTVKEITKKSMTIQLTDGTERKLPRSYAEKYLTHAYAVTVHKAQGMTCDTAHVMATESIARESGYVAASRTREISHFYTPLPTDLTTDPEGTTHGHELLDEREVTERAAGWFSRAANENAALGHDVRVSVLRARMLDDEALLAAVTARNMAMARGDVGGQREAEDLINGHRYAASALAVIAPPKQVVQKIGAPPVLPDARRIWREQAGRLLVQEQLRQTGEKEAAIWEPEMAAEQEVAL